MEEDTTQNRKSYCDFVPKLKQNQSRIVDKGMRGKKSRNPKRIVEKYFTYWGT